MPLKREKLLKKMKQSKAGWKLTDLYTLYESFGFTIDNGSNHDIVTHPDYPELRATLPRHRKVAKVYVQQAIKIIEAYKSISEQG